MYWGIGVGIEQAVRYARLKMQEMRGEVQSADRDLEVDQESLVFKLQSRMTLPREQRKQKGEEHLGLSSDRHTSTRKDESTVEWGTFRRVWWGRSLRKKMIQGSV